MKEQYRPLFKKANKSKGDYEKLTKVRDELKRRYLSLLLQSPPVADSVKLERSLWTMCFHSHVSEFREAIQKVQAKVCVL